MVRRKVNYQLYFIAGIISFIIFFSGFFLGWKLNVYKLDYLRSDINSLHTDVQSSLLEFMFLDVMESNVSCNFLKERVSELGETANSIGKKIETYESSEKFENVEYKNLKNEYMDILLRYWLFSEKIKNSCQDDFMVVLYFYRNEPTCQECMNQGVVLDYYKRQLKDDVLIFPFDTGLNSPVASFLMKAFDITTIPSLVIEDVKYDGFVNRDELKNSFCQNLPDLEIC